MQRLHAAHHAGQRLDRDTHDVVDRLLRGERNAGGLRMRAQHHRARVLRAEALLHDARPHAARRAQLGDLLEEVVVQVPKERQARREFVDVEAALDALVDVADAVGDSERELLHRGRAGLADVVAGDRDRVPARNLLRAELDHVGDDPDRGPRRTDPFLLRDELLEHVVLDRAGDFVPRHALALGDHEIHRQQHRGRAVDRHRGRNLVERDAIEQARHVVDRGYRDALASDLAARALVVGVVAHQARHVERGRKAVLPLREQEVEALVGVLGEAEARELAHRPQPPAVHRLVHAARIWKLARVAERALVVALYVLGRVERLDLQVGDGREAHRPLLSFLISAVQPLTLGAHVCLTGPRVRGSKLSAVESPKCLRKSP